METSRDKTVADFVTENIKTAHVFKKHGIDFCCGGGISIENACAKNNVDQALLEKELVVVDTISERILDYDKWAINFLIDHIINVHHTYVNESLPMLLQYANKVARVHGQHYKEVVEINKLIHDVANELLLHLQKEEEVLFPYIKQLVASQKEEGKSQVSSPFGSVNNPIRMMEHEHENAGNIFKEIARLTNKYSPPPEACNTFRALYAKLEEFEQDLHLHIHLENNILHPKAIALEEKMS
ncbi:iron-sulfur cluster repair di-iron protein [Flagellimonas pacifica]|uniref:Regulator of cell morphogenesis and NO signaling n=1 Tax=Flagellimonas pacifica TaxID=1247520 RepID=A0A285MW97_9FLAO|nr:iron-sulfur cluster repair di-iron protein [Allomuricauda parva]SNZ01462.1 regulator of cell morphogenesis and NO signaling [Allomuricauda parva]